MSKPGKDSPEVLEFMTRFARLKHWCDDGSETLVEFAASDPSVEAAFGQEAARVFGFKKGSKSKFF